MAIRLSVSFFILIFLFACGDKRSEQATEVFIPEDYHSRFTPQKVIQQIEPGFSLTFKLNDALYLIGSRKQGNDTYLLNNELGKVWKSNTGEDLEYFEKLSDVNWSLTKINDQPEQEIRYDLAFTTNDSFQYQQIPSEIINDSTFINDIDKEIKLSGYIDTLLAYDDKFPNDFVIGKRKPKITRFKLPNGEALIVTYIYLEAVPGPRMIILNNMIYPLTGPCSYQHAYPFRINNRLFIQTGSNCCECGWIIDQVFEITNDEVVLAFQDDSYSE